MAKTLLLADDSITIQKVVGITFANEDYQIVSVDNGEDALKKAQEIKPDIVLADVVMPKMDGYEVCEKLKNDPSLQTTPVLLLTGAFKSFDEERSKKVGADGHIAKPFDSQSLIDKVNMLVSKPKTAPQMATTLPPQPPPTPHAPPPIAPPTFSPPPAFAPKPPQAPSPLSSSGANDPFTTPMESSPQSSANEVPGRLSSPPTPSIFPSTPPTAPDTPSPMELSMFEGLPPKIPDPPKAPSPFPSPMASHQKPEQVPENIWDVPGAPGASNAASPTGSASPFASPSPFSPPEPKPKPSPFAAPPTVPPGPPTAPSSPFSQPLPSNPWAAPSEGPKSAPSSPFANFPRTEIPSSPLPPPPAFSRENEITAFSPNPSAPKSEPPLDISDPFERIEGFSSEPSALDSFSIPPQPVSPTPPEPIIQPKAPDAISSPSMATAPSSADQADMKGMTREIIEKVAWEIIPDMAETIIREEIERIKKNKGVFT